MLALLQLLDLAFGYDAEDNSFIVHGNSWLCGVCNPATLDTESFEG